MVVKNFLLNSDYVIYQDDSWFKFSLDSVLLSNFVSLNLTDKKIMDFCTGNAPIPMLLYNMTHCKIDCIEIQKVVYELGYRSIIENKMDDRIEIFNYDVNNVKTLFDSESYDLVLCNPPYFKNNASSIISCNDVKSIARHEICIDFEGVVRNASFLLKTGGRFSFVHRPERLMEFFEVMKKYKIEPKKIQFVYSKLSKVSNTVLVEGIKNGKCGLKVLKPLIIYNEDNTYTDDVLSYFK